jgi:hypothetical protein
VLLCWLLTSCYRYPYIVQFSGFPFSSEDSKTRLRTLSRLGLLWTSARLGWGIVALTTVVEGWLNEARKSTLFYTIVLVGTLLLFTICSYTNCCCCALCVLYHICWGAAGDHAPL